jgi:hypothetical protein
MEDKVDILVYCCVVDVLMFFMMMDFVVSSDIF